MKFYSYVLDTIILLLLLSFRNNIVGFCYCCCLFVCLLCSPQEDGRIEEKELEGEMFFSCLELNANTFMLNSLCSEIHFTVMLSAFCLCGPSSERLFASVSHKAKD